MTPIYFDEMLKKLKQKLIKVFVLYLIYGSFSDVSACYN